MTFAPQNPYHFSHLLIFTFSTPSTVPAKGSFDFLSSRDRLRCLSLSLTTSSTSRLLCASPSDVGGQWLKLYICACSLPSNF
nr:hypothetical protein CFP56_29368 [Quercus suber]